MRIAWPLHFEGSNEMAATTTKRAVNTASPKLAAAERVDRDRIAVVRKVALLVPSISDV
jgi:hypothetical protein